MRTRPERASEGLTVDVAEVGQREPMGRQHARTFVGGVLLGASIIYVKTH